MPVQPAGALLVHQLGKFLMVFRKAALLTPALIDRAGVFSFRRTAPGAQGTAGIVRVRLSLFPQIAPGQDGQHPGHPFKLLQHIEGKTPQPAPVILVSGRVTDLPGVAGKLFFFIDHGLLSNAAASILSSRISHSSFRYPAATTYFTVSPAITSSSNNVLQAPATASRVLWS